MNFQVFKLVLFIYLFFQAGFRKGRGTRDQVANIHWIIEKAIKFQKNIHFCFVDYAKAFDCVDHNGNKNKINKWDLIKLKSFCTGKETISKVKIQPSEWEKIIASGTTFRGLISKIYKQPIQHKTRKTKNPIKN